MGSWGPEGTGRHRSRRVVASKRETLGTQSQGTLAFSLLLSLFNFLQRGTKALSILMAAGPGVTYCHGNTREAEAGGWNVLGQPGRLSES